MCRVEFDSAAGCVHRGSRQGPSVSLGATALQLVG